ncbi:MAG: hypothetical protein DRJ37_01520 [Thermoprotei archaeon]|nr:MAG: hypothetical protein DRJ37_01520 [Thermoprotei archaeon]
MKDKVDKDILQRARIPSKQISVVKDALIAVESREVHAMHDPTEGGVANGLFELALASGYGFIAYEKDIIVLPETEVILGHVGADLLTTISSGSLLIVSPPSSTMKIIKKLKSKGISAAKIGKIVEDPDTRIIVRKDGKEMKVSENVKEDLWRVSADILK